MAVNSVDNRASVGKAALLGGAVGTAGGIMHANYLIKNNKAVKDAFLKATEDMIDKYPNIKLETVKNALKIGKGVMKTTSAFIFGTMGAGLFAVGAAIYNKIKS